MLHSEALQTARALLEQPAAERHRELRAAFPGYFRYLLFHLFAWPYLAHRGWKIAKQRNELDLTWLRLSGGTPPPDSSFHHGTLILSTDLGETRAALLAAEQIHATDPSMPIACLVTLRRSYEFARGQHLPFPIGYIPYNNPTNVLLMLRRWKPQTILFANHNSNHHHLTYLAKWQGIKTVVINASLTESDAARRHRQEKQRGFISWRRTEIGAWAVQTEIDKKRLLDLSVNERRMVVTGPLYSSVQRTEEEMQRLPSYWRAFLNLNPAQKVPVVVAGSTYPPEEDLLLEAFAAFQRKFPGAVLVLAPRTLTREGGPDSTVKSHNVPYVRRSEVKYRPSDINIVILDTLGELKDIYAAADIAHVGGSFDKIVGSHTPVEALSWGIPMTIGPHYTQQAALVDNLVESDLLVICRNSHEIANAWNNAADADTTERERIRERAKNIRQGSVIEDFYRAILQRTADLQD